MYDEPYDEEELMAIGPLPLIGESSERPAGMRVPINIDERVRERLRRLLFKPEMRGVGYSEFINRAINAAIIELINIRAEKRERGAY